MPEMNPTPKFLLSIEGCFYNDPVIPDIDLSKIKAMPGDEAGQKWEKYVSKKNRHFMLLGDDEWPSLIVDQNEPLYTWQEDWNDDKPQQLQSLFDTMGMSNDDEVIIFWMKEIAATMPWYVFYENWINFLYEDEGVILINTENNSAIIMSNGLIWFSSRIGEV